MKINIFLFISLFLLSDSVFAEGGCPPGSYPANPPATNVCNPLPDSGNNNQVQQSLPRGRWQTRWGAIAIGSGETGDGIGLVRNKTSKKAAEQAAILQCRNSGGGVGCEPAFTYYNQCAVIAWGDTRPFLQGAESLEIASKLAMDRCIAKDKNCKIVYTDCTDAEWVSY